MSPNFAKRLLMVDYDPMDAAALSMNRGAPLMSGKPDHPLAKHIIQLADAIGQAQGSRL